MNQQDTTFPCLVVFGLAVLWLSNFYSSLSETLKVLCFMGVFAGISCAGAAYYYWFSKFGRDRRRVAEQILEIPACLQQKSSDGVFMGIESDLNIPVYLPDSVRCRHVHILGATGSGKTESVILNFLGQDVDRGLGSIVLDAKGGISFLQFLKNHIPQERLQVFDLGSEESFPYNPIAAGKPLEAAQRLFSSLTWSEEYYKSKALSALQRLFQTHFEINDRNPTLADLASYLAHPDSYAAFVNAADYPPNLAMKEYQDLSGLCDQVRSLTIGHLGKILSPTSDDQMDIEAAGDGKVVYFRLQSLMSPQLVSTVGKLIINHINYLAGTAHRGIGPAKCSKLVPTYFDEFATFACPEFADLISKARSAGIALHFSHQSIGDIEDVSPGFLGRITDNSATKIVLRINDPDSAEYLARSFGTRDYQKVTQRITNAKEVDVAEVVGEGTTRDAHQFRASPDLLKTHPIGVGSVLIAHGYNTPHGASSVFRIRFPRLSVGSSNSLGEANDQSRSF